MSDLADGDELDDLLHLMSYQSAVAYVVKVRIAVIAEVLLSYLLLSKSFGSAVVARVSKGHCLCLVLSLRVKLSQMFLG